MLTNLPKEYIRLYNQLIKSPAKALTSSSLKDQAELYFHWDEFSAWLKTKFNSNINENNYQTLITKNNLSDYFKHFQKTKKPEKAKSAIESYFDALRMQQNSGSVKKPYDIDLMEVYTELNTLLKGKKLLTGFNKKTYLERFEDILKIQCELKDLPFKLVIESKTPLLPERSEPHFEIHIGRALIVYDLLKISAFLDHQMTMWKEPTQFVDVVEHAVYKYVKKNSPFDNTKRLEKIVDWVKGKKESTSVNTQRRLSRSVSTSSGVSTYYFWPYPLEKLKRLQKLLLEENLLASKTDFVINFKSYKSKVEKPTKWNGSLRQLMLLLYLIYQQKTIYRNQRVYFIALGLFHSEDKSFNKKGLSTILSQVADVFKNPSEMTGKLKLIHELFQKLEVAIVK